MKSKIKSGAPFLEIFLQNFIFFSFFCNLFYKDIILRKIRVAEGVAEGLQKDDGYTIRSLRIDDGIFIASFRGFTYTASTFHQASETLFPYGK
jgi:hypothetical protein